MTLRVAFTVALALALLAASLPAIESARVQHSEARIAAEVQRLERAATALAAENDVVDAGQPARARFTLHLPSRSWGDSGVGQFRIQPRCATRDVVWSARDGRRQSHRLSSVTLAGAAGGLAIPDGGRSRLVLELRREGDRRVVIVSRPRANSED